MELRILEIDEVLLWYENFLKKDFISDEIKPIENILELIKKNRYVVYGIYNQKKMIGYASFWKKRTIDLVLLDYFGISEGYRNLGFGSKALSLIRETLGEIPYVVESEIPIGDNLEEDEIRKRRIDFYERNGCKKVYLMATCGLKWQTLLNSNLDFNEEDLAKLHKELYDEKRRDVKIPVSMEEKVEKAFWKNK